MLVDPTLSVWSDRLFQATLVVLLLAMVFASLEYAARRIARTEPPVEVGAASVPASRNIAVGLAEPGGNGTGGGRAGAVTRTRWERCGRIGVSLMTLAVATHLGSIVLRGLATYRWPLGNMYEFTSALCMLAVAAWVLLVQRHPSIRPAGIFVLTSVVLLMFVTGTVIYAEAAPVVPALQSYWIIIHVTAITLAAGMLLVAGVASLLFLIRRHGRPKLLAAELPSAEALDRLAYRVTVLAFPLYTFAIIAGAAWAEAAWGRFWGWDPKEVVSFVAWVLYAAYLHARATAGWQSSRAAWINAAGFAAIVFNLFFINMVVAGLHSYAGV